MDIFATILSMVHAIFKKPETTGFLPDPVDERDAWYDHVFGAVDPKTFKPSIDWTPQVKLRRQGYWPFCVSYAAAHCFYHMTGKELSVRYLAAKSGTTYRGTSIRAVLETLRKGAPLEQDFPFDFNTPLNKWDLVMNLSSLQSFVLNKNGENKIDGYVRFDPRDSNSLKAGLQTGPLIVAYGIGDGYGNGGVVRTPGYYRYYHCVVLTGYDEKGNWRVGDSLIPQEKLLSGSYSIPWVYQITTLPEDWKNRQVEHLFNSYTRLLKERFGKPRDFANEQAEAALLVKLIKPLVAKRPALAGNFGRFWVVYVAAFYGGWTLQDCIDDCVHYTDTGKHLHNFNEEKE